MEKQERLKELLQSIISQTEKSELATSQDVIDQMIEHLQN